MEISKYSKSVKKNKLGIAKKYKKFDLKDKKNKMF